MTTLTDEDLTALLGEVTGSYDVPEDGPELVLAALTAEPTVVPLRQRRWAQGLAAAAVIAAAFAGGALLDRADATPPDNQLAATGPESLPRPAADQSLSDVVDPQSGASSRAAAPAPAGALTYGGYAAQDSARTPNSSAPDFAAAPPDQQAAAEQPPTAVQSAPGPGVQAPAPDGARVIKNGSIALIVTDGRVTPTLTAVQQAATDAGGVVASGETQESGETPSGTVTLRVPVARFEQVVAAVRGLDAEVRAATTSGRDVTGEYTDVEAQLRTLRAARERFLEILSGARTIGDVLTVQQRVDDVTGQIDRLEGQRALLQAQSDMATLQVSVTEADDPVVRVNEKPDDGLSKAFRDGWGGFTSGIEALIAASGRAVLVLLCAALVVVVLRLGWRVSRRRLV